VSDVRTLHSTSTCRSCGRPIRWARSEANGKSLPLDPEPKLGGNLVEIGTVVGKYGQDVPVVRVVEPIEDVRRFVSHFATCPQADEWRRE
jgi:hypothetical protein